MVIGLAVSIIAVGLLIGAAAGLAGATAQARSQIPAVAAVAAVPPTPTPTARPKASITYMEPTQPVLVDWSELETGDCLGTWPQDDHFVNGLLAPCSGNHVAEAYKTFMLGKTGRFPGSKVMEVRADALCSAALGNALTTDWENRKLEEWYTYPSDSTWADGDRKITCFIVLIKGQWRGHHDRRLGR